MFEFLGAEETVLDLMDCYLPKWLTGDLNNK